MRAYSLHHPKERASGLSKIELFLHIFASLTESPFMASLHPEEVTFINDFTHIFTLILQ